MAGDTIITVVGNLTHDPELRFTPSGAAVASFTIASTPRTYDRQSGEWKDGDALFMRCSLWRDAAENVAESLTKGMRVIAQGRLVQRSYTTREGEQRTVVEMQVDEIGPSLRYAKAQVTRNSRGGGTVATMLAPAMAAATAAPRVATTPTTTLLLVATAVTTAPRKAAALETRGLLAALLSVTNRRSKPARRSA